MEDFLDEQRVALGRLHDRSRELMGRRLQAKTLEECRNLGLVETPQRKRVADVLPLDAGQQADQTLPTLPWPVGTDKEKGDWLTLSRICQRKHEMLK